MEGNISEAFLAVSVQWKATLLFCLNFSEITQVTRWVKFNLLLSEVSVNLPSNNRTNLQIKFNRRLSQFNLRLDLTPFKQPGPRVLMSANHMLGQLYKMLGR